MSGISELYNPENSGALIGAETFSKIFQAKPDATFLLGEIDSDGLASRLCRLTNNPDQQYLSDYLLTLLAEYRPVLQTVKTSVGNFNIPEYAMSLQQRLTSEGTLFWASPLRVTAALVIAECLARAEMPIPSEAEINATQPTSSSTAALPALDEIAARKKRNQEIVRTALADITAPSESQAGETTSKSWEMCESLSDITQHLHELGFADATQYREMQTIRGQHSVFASHHYFVHSNSGLIASYDKFPGQKGRVAFYASLAEANAVPGCFLDFTDAVKIASKTQDVKFRLAIARIHDGDNHALNPAPLIRQLEKADQHRALINLNQMPLAPIGFDKYGHLVWHSRQGVDHTAPSDLTTALTTLIATASSVQMSAPEYLEHDKKAPRLSRVVTQYGVAPEQPMARPVRVQRSRTATLPETPRIRAREPISLDGIENSGMKALATSWNAGMNTAELAEQIGSSPAYVYLIADKLRENPGFVLRKYKDKSQPDTKPQASRANREILSLDGIENEKMLKLAKDWNAGKPTSEIAKELDVSDNGVYNAIGRLREDPAFILRRYRSDNDGNAQRKPIATEGIIDDRMKGLADKWNSKIPADAIAEDVGTSTSYLSTIITRLRADPTYVIKQFREKGQKSKSTGHKGRKRTPITIEGITDPQMLTWAERWNGPESLDEVAKDLGTSEQTLRRRIDNLRIDPKYHPDRVSNRQQSRFRAAIPTQGITDPDMKTFAETWNDTSLTRSDLERIYGTKIAGLNTISRVLKADPQYIWSRYKKKVSAQTPKQSQPIARKDAPKKRGSLRRIIPIDVVEKIQDEKVKAFAAAWNQGTDIAELVQRYQLGSARIMQIASHIRVNPLYAWRPINRNKNETASTGLEVSSRHTNLSADEVARFLEGKKNKLGDIRKLFKSSLCFDIDFKDEAAIIEDFTDAETAQPALKQLGFIQTSEKANGRLERYYQHASGLKLRMVVEDEHEPPEYTLAFGLFEMATAPSDYTDLRARDGYRASFELDGHNVSRRVVMYTSPIDANDIGQRLLELRAGVNNGLFALLPYTKTLQQIGKANIIASFSPQPHFESGTLEKQLAQSGIVVERIDTADTVESVNLEPNPTETMLPSVPIVNVVIAGLKGEERTNLVNQLRGQNKSNAAEILDALSKNMEAVLGPAPTYNINVIRADEDKPAFDDVAINAKLDSSNQNILCIGVTAETHDRAVDFIKNRREARDESLAIAITDQLTLEQRLKLFSGGFDDVQESGIDAAVLGGRMLALHRRQRSRSAIIQKFGPLSVHWSSEGGFERVSVSSETRTQPIPLTGKESQILACLVHNRGKCLTKEMLLNHLYANVPSSDHPDIKIIDVFICKLRKKLVDGMVAVGYPVTRDLNPIDTNWGRGYTFNPNFGQNVKLLASMRQVTSGQMIEPSRPLGLTSDPASAQLGHELS